MSLFAILKHLHVWFALLTFVSLTLRFVWLNSQSSILRHPIVRILPHINDTALLITGISMAYVLGYSPIATSWFGAKLLLIVVYIVLGFILFKAPLSRLYRYLIYVLCFITYGAIIIIVVSKPH